MSHWVMPADLDEYGVSVSVDGDRLALSVPPDTAVNDLMTSVAAVLPLRDDHPSSAAPMFCSDAFRHWYEGSGLTGLRFTAALGAPELFEIAIAEGEGTSFFCRGNQAMLLCDDAAAAALQQSGFALELMDDPG
jgi:hypothetical protein